MARCPGGRRGVKQLLLHLITPKFFNWLLKCKKKIRQIPIKKQTFLTSLVSMQRSIRSTVAMSMYSLHMSFIHLVKLSTIVWKSTQVNFMMLNTRLMMLSNAKEKTFMSSTFSGCSE